MKRRNEYRVHVLASCSKFLHGELRRKLIMEIISFQSLVKTQHLITKSYTAITNQKSNAQYLYLDVIELHKSIFKNRCFV